MKPGHKGKKVQEWADKSHFMPPLLKNLQVLNTHHRMMFADRNTPLFKLNNEDKNLYEDNPAIIQARANLAAVEHIQQEKAEQRRLEREEWRVEAEVERLRGKLRRWRGCGGSWRMQS